MNSVLTLGKLAVTEYYRKKLLIVLLLSMLIVAGTGLLSNPFTLGVQNQFMSEMALVYIRFYSIVLALALSATALPNEIERKIIYPWLANPITRSQYVWGKFWAIAAIAAFNAVILGAELMLIIKLSGGGAHFMICAACFLIFMEALVVTGFTLWFSTLVTAPVTFAFVTLLYVIGDLSHIYAVSLTTGNTVMHWVLIHLKSLLPYFEYFSIRSAVVHEYPVHLSYILSATVYGLLYIVLTMLLAEIVFSKKDL